MNKKIFALSILLIYNSLLYSFDLFKDDNKELNKQYKSAVNYQVKEKINEIFNKYENQSLRKDENLIYYRPDMIKRRTPSKYLIWTRADAISFNNNSYLYIIPEGYKIIYEKEGEIYIDYEPTKEKEKLEF